METCACPGCDQPGTNKCSACETTPYCGPICQTADWLHHKEECPGHLRKVGMANLARAKGFSDAKNWPQTLRYSDIAATKLKQIKDRPIEDIDAALNYKFLSLNVLGRHKEALECAKEWYCLYLTKHTHPPAIVAGFALIESCIFNGEFFDAVLYARTTWETLTLSRDSHIPDNQRDVFTAHAAYMLAKALHGLAGPGGMPANEQQEAGREAIMLARKALEIHTQLYGLEHAEVANDILLVAQVLGHFNGYDDDEIPRHYEQAKSIFARVEGSLSPNVATCHYNLGRAYCMRAKKANATPTHDVDREVVNLELALPRYREAARIYRAINRMDDANDAARHISIVEQAMRRAAAAAVATRG